MGKGEARGRAGRRAAGRRRRRIIQHHRRNNNRRRHRQGRTEGGASSSSSSSSSSSTGVSNVVVGGNQSARSQIQSRLVAFGIFCLIPGIILTVMYRGSGGVLPYFGYAMLAFGILQILVAWGLRCRAGNGAQNNDATPQVQQVEEGVPQVEGTAMQTLSVGGLQRSLSDPGFQQPPPYPDFSAGQPYPGSQPYPGPAAAGGFGPAPSAPAPSGPAPPPQYGFTYNTSDNYNTQYSSGTSDLPPPPAYSTVVNEKL